jgi:hypothetical protein
LLLQLPLPALQLLLSSDHLRVASEDTVLYSITQYAHHRDPYYSAEYAAQMAEYRQAAATAVLAPLVRAPHLSGCVLSGQVLSSRSSTMVLGHYNQQLKQLLSHKVATKGLLMPADVLMQISGAPPAWQLGQRQIVALQPVQLVWRVRVQDIAQACRDSFAGDKLVRIECPVSSPVMGGTAWTLWLDCQQNQKDRVRGTDIVLNAVPKDAELMFGGDVFLVFSCTLTCSSLGISSCLDCPGSYMGRGRCDFFGLGLMSEGGGWDEAAWAAKGLPTSGEVELSLHMHSVG